MRAELQSIVDALLAASQDSREVHIDAVGEAFGARPVTAVDIEQVIDALESVGRTITSPEGGRGEDRLRAVVAAARELGPELGRKPTVRDIAVRAGISEDEVRHALALARVVQRT